MKETDNENEKEKWNNIRKQINKGKKRSKT
jgi:hypothetical protein